MAGSAGRPGLTPTTDRFGVAPADLVRCRSCGHRQTDPMPAAGTLERAYRDAAPADDLDLAEETGRRETARRALERIARRLPTAARPPRLLDLGCWVGFLLAEARDRGWDTTGVEPSTIASAYARDRLGLDVRTGGLLDVPHPPGHFDAVVLGDVVEHLPDPGTALDHVATLLRPGGIALVVVPDAGSLVARAMGRRWWSVLPTHVQYFTRRSMRALLTRRGWSVLEITTAPNTLSVRYYVRRVGGYSPSLAQLLIAAVGAAGLGDRLWTPDFHDRMAVVALWGLRATDAGAVESQPAPSAREPSRDPRGE